MSDRKGKSGNFEAAFAEDNTCPKCHGPIEWAALGLPITTTMLLRGEAITVLYWAICEDCKAVIFPEQKSQYVLPGGTEAHTLLDPPRKTKGHYPK